MDKREAGRLGGLKGGKMRAARLSAEQRQNIARKGGTAKGENARRHKGPQYRDKEPPERCFMTRKELRAKGRTLRQNFEAWYREEKRRQEKKYPRGRSYLSIGQSIT